MKKLFLMILCMLPTSVFSSASYNPGNGIVHMSNVSIGSDNYEVNMTHQDGLLFSVSDATKKTLSQAIIGTWKASSVSAIEMGDDSYFFFQDNGKYLSVEYNVFSRSYMFMNVGTYSVDESSSSITLTITFRAIGEDVSDGGIFGSDGTYSISLMGDQLTFTERGFPLSRVQ
jgi:hypothetical protein